MVQLPLLAILTVLLLLANHVDDAKADSECFNPLIGRTTKSDEFTNQYEVLLLTTFHPKSPHVLCLIRRFFLLSLFAGRISRPTRSLAYPASASLPLPLLPETNPPLLLRFRNNGRRMDRSTSNTLTCTKSSTNVLSFAASQTMLQLQLIA